MNIRAALVKVLAGNSIAQLLTGCLGLYLINVLSSDMYATYTLYQSLLFLVVGVVVNPFNRIVILNDSISGDSNFFIAQLFLLTPLLVFSWWYLSGDEVLISLFLMSSVALVFFEYEKSIAQKNLRFTLFKRLVAGRAVMFVTLCLGLFLVADIGDYNYVYVVMLSGSISWVALAIAGIKSRGTGSQWKVDGKQLGLMAKLIKSSSPIFLYFILSSILSQMDFIFLRFLSDSQQLSTYGASFQYYLFLILVMNSLKQVLLPMLSREKGLSIVELTRQLSSVYYLYVILVVSLVVTSPYWTFFVEGGKYQESPLVFSILSISSIFSMVLSPSSEILQANNKYKFMLLVLVATCAINAILNYVLVTGYGAVGVSLATLISFVFLNSMFAVKSMKSNVG